MRKWIVGFFVVGTVLWLWAYHESHRPCEASTSGRPNMTWNCPAGAVRIDLTSDGHRTAFLIATAPLAVTWDHRFATISTTKSLVLRSVKHRTLVVESVVPFTAYLEWFRDDQIWRR